MGFVVIGLWFCDNFCHQPDGDVKSLAYQPSTISIEFRFLSSLLQQFGLQPLPIWQLVFDSLVLLAISSRKLKIAHRVRFVGFLPFWNFHILLSRKINISWLVFVCWFINLFLCCEQRKKLFINAHLSSIWINIWIEKMYIPTHKMATKKHSFNFVIGESYRSVCRT